MVRVFYEPPPYGPKTCLNRTSYGVHGGGLFGQTLERVSKMKNGPIMAGLVAGICAICYLPLVGSKLPFSMEPEYQAAQRSYMRYHNMNPISGISSKKARATEP
uniref:Uncharacterized protein n=1 Tax=Amphora coffeiformis TaxID=265554 RepID=A0A7S3L8R8_9STRA|mmetsp:Transcript_9026/g.17241  ORF Transcript_9026/g.17241 Transcript_9026/m.17241 type:complete len:104 (+) Transcript_9026:93-404(+)